MTKREYDVVIDSTETIEICDHCGFGAEEGGLLRYEPRPTGLKGEFHDLHYHPECLEKMEAYIPVDPPIKEVAEETLTFPPVLIMDKPDVIVGGVGIVSLLIAAAVAGSGDYSAAVAISIPGVLFPMSVSAAKENAKRVVERINRRWDL